MQEKLNEIERINDEMQRQMDRFAGLLKTAYANPNPAVMQILRQESRELNRQADLLNQKLDNMKEQSSMKRTLLTVMALFVLLVFVSSFAVAQDSPLETNTPQIVESTATLVSSEPIPTAFASQPAPIETEQPPVIDDEPTRGDSSLIELVKVAMPWIGGIVIVAVLVLGVLGREFIVRLGKSAPVYVREPIFSGVETGLAKLEDYTHTTETTIDDIGAEELRKFVLGVIADIRADEQAKAAPQSAIGADVTLGSAGAWHQPTDTP